MRTALICHSVCPARYTQNALKNKSVSAVRAHQPQKKAKERDEQLVARIDTRRWKSNYRHTRQCKKNNKSQNSPPCGKNCENIALKLSSSTRPVGHSCWQIKLSVATSGRRCGVISSQTHTHALVRK